MKLLGPYLTHEDLYEALRRECQSIPPQLVPYMCKQYPGCPRFFCQPENRALRIVRDDSFPLTEPTDDQPPTRPAAGR